MRFSEPCLTRPAIPIGLKLAVVTEYARTLYLGPASKVNENSLTVKFYLIYSISSPSNSDCQVLRMVYSMIFGFQDHGQCKGACPLSESSRNTSMQWSLYR